MGGAVQEECVYIYETFPSDIITVDSKVFQIPKWCHDFSSGGMYFEKAIKEKPENSKLVGTQKGTV